jgi:hypothetical protein
MRQFTSIIFVLIFVLAGKSQSQDLSKNQFFCNSVYVVSDNTSGANQILFQDQYFDVQDLNDFNCFDSVFVITDSQIYHHHSIKETVTDVLPGLQSIKVIEFLLDLPPPLLSV